MYVFKNQFLNPKSYIKKQKLLQNEPEDKMTKKRKRERDECFEQIGELRAQNDCAQSELKRREKKAFK